MTENARFFAYCVRILALKIVDNLIWYGTLCSWCSWCSLKWCYIQRLMLTFKSKSHEMIFSFFSLLKFKVLFFIVAAAKNPPTIFCREIRIKSNCFMHVLIFKYGIPWNFVYFYLISTLFIEWYVKFKPVPWKALSGQDFKTILCCLKIVFFSIVVSQKR